MQWQCGVCKNIFPVATAPEKCPICGASQDKFSQYTPAQAQATITPTHSEFPCNYTYDGMSTPKTV